MKPDEKIVFDYLKSEGYKSIVFEPEGNNPPDFLIEGNIAIEVRRLNENYFSGDTAIGHREEYYSLWQLISDFLEGYSNNNLKSNYWLSISFERPIPDHRILKKKLKLQLDTLILNPIIGINVEVTPTFWIRLYPRGTKSKNRLTLASSVDNDGGGIVNHIYVSNINYCINEKAGKIRKVREKYSQWWLILVDRIVFREADADMDFLKKYLDIGDWDNVIVINPENLRPVLNLPFEYE